jgi:hypothetical protein
MVLDNRSAIALHKKIPFSLEHIRKFLIFAAQFVRRQEKKIFNVLGYGNNNIRKILA